MTVRILHLDSLTERPVDVNAVISVNATTLCSGLIIQIAIVSARTHNFAILRNTGMPGNANVSVRLSVVRQDMGKIYRPALARKSLALHQMEDVDGDTIGINANVVYLKRPADLYDPLLSYFPHTINHDKNLISKNKIKCIFHGK